MRDNAAAFTDEVTQGGTYIDGAGNVRRISTKLRGIFGSPQPAVRQLFHYGNNEGKWAPTTGLREHQYAGYLDDYYAASRALPQRTPQTPQLKALTALENQRAFREGRDIPEETAPDNINNLKIALAHGTYTDKDGILRGVPDELKAIAGEVGQTSSHLWHSGAPEGWAPLTQDPSHGWDAVRRHNDPQNLARSQIPALKQNRGVPRQSKFEW